MKPQTVQKVDKNTIFISGLLTSFFLLCEVSFFILCNKAYFSDFSYVSSHINLPFAMIYGILFFIFAQLLLHAFYTAWVVWISNSLQHKFFSNKKFQDHFVIGIWCIGIITILFANQIYFPQSKFSEITSSILPLIFVQYFFYFGMIICGLLSTIILYDLISLLLKHFKMISAFCFIFIFSIWIFHNKNATIVPPSKNTKPNIFIIGVDSLRPDFLSYFNAINNTSNLDKFLTHATVFSEAITPLARTFPSWTAILTGQYPRNNGVRFNLASKDNFKFQHTLAQELKNLGYKTIYATDETRFSNIDQSFGFDELITPPVGINDFLIGTFNDFPISNLLVNTIIGRFLFPYNYGNRAAYVTYDPQTFLAEIKTQLTQKISSPLFLAVHFCLPHFPFVYKDSPVDKTPVENYRNAIERVDQQVGEYLNLLAQKKLLVNAIVILLSDHGEGLALAGDRITEDEFYLSSSNQKPPQFYPQSLDNEKINQSSGHGTDVLGLPQYHTLLAVRLYGSAKQTIKNVSGVVSLLDVTPTILDFLNVSSRTDGRSLKKIILGQSENLAPRHHFLESDYAPTSILTVFPEMRKVVLEGLEIFEIDKRSTKLTVKKKMGELIIRSKQMADIYENWMLALYPQKDNTYIPILVNLKTGEWTNDLATSFAKQSKAAVMLNALKNFYDLQDLSCPLQFSVCTQNVATALQNSRNQVLKR